MGKYGENYKKMLDGYNKIINCIDSIELIEHMEGISNLTESWVSLIDHYSDQIYNDKSNKHRKLDANKFCDAGVKMFEDLRNVCQKKIQSITPIDYEGNFSPVRIKTLQEMSGEKNYN